MPITSTFVSRLEPISEYNGSTPLASSVLPTLYHGNQSTWGPAALPLDTALALYVTSSGLVNAQHGVAPAYGLRLNPDKDGLAALARIIRYPRLRYRFA